MSDDKKFCRKCRAKGTPQPAEKYPSDDSTVFEFDNAEGRGYKCSNPKYALIFGALGTPARFASQKPCEDSKPETRLAPRPSS
jgi:hypothetical protein